MARKTKFTRNVGYVDNVGDYVINHPKSSRALKKKENMVSFTDVQ